MSTYKIFLFYDTNTVHIKIGRLGMSGVYPLDMPRTPYRASEGKRSQ